MVGPRLSDKSGLAGNLRDRAVVGRATSGECLKVCRPVCFERLLPFDTSAFAGPC